MASAPNPNADALPKADRILAQSVAVELHELDIEEVEEHAKVLNSKLRNNFAVEMEMLQSRI